MLYTNTGHGGRFLPAPAWRTRSASDCSVRSAWSPAACSKCALPWWSPRLSNPYWNSTPQTLGSRCPRNDGQSSQPRAATPPTRTERSHPARVIAGVAPVVILTCCSPLRIAGETLGSDVYARPEGRVPRSIYGLFAVKSRRGLFICSFAISAVYNESLATHRL